VFHGQLSALTSIGCLTCQDIKYVKTMDGMGWVGKAMNSKHPLSNSLKKVASDVL